MRELQKHGQAQPFVGDTFSREFLGEKEEETSKKGDDAKGVKRDDGTAPMETDAGHDDGLPVRASFYMKSSKVNFATFKTKKMNLKSSSKNATR